MIRVILANEVASMGVAGPVGRGVVWTVEAICSRKAGGLGFRIN